MPKTGVSLAGSARDGKAYRTLRARKRAFSKAMAQLDKEIRRQARKKGWNTTAPDFQLPPEDRLHIERKAADLWAYWFPEA